MCYSGICEPYKVASFFELSQEFDPGAYGRSIVWMKHVLGKEQDIK